MCRGLHRQCCGDGLFLPLDVLRHGNARWVDDVHDVDADAGPDLDCVGHKFSAHVAGYDGGNDAALRAANAVELSAFSG